MPSWTPYLFENKRARIKDDRDSKIVKIQREQVQSGAELQWVQLKLT